MSQPSSAPRLLIVVPTLNSHALLARLLDSLQAQTWPHWRLLFVDGPSGSKHRQWLERCCNAESRCRWLRQDPAEPGIFGAMNQGFAAAGPHEWLLFWGSDDWAAAEDVFERAMAALAAVPDLLVCRGRYVSSAPGDATPGRSTAFRWRGSYRRSLFLGSTPPHQATLIGPGARQRLARYAPGFRLSADLDYFLQLSRWPELRVQVLDLELVHMAPGGVSGVQHRRRLQEVRHAYRRAFGWRWPVPFLMRYLQRIISALP
ncbi:glycosyltransferase [Synechococcus sp. EJ6-Ellesmere]|uniref:glycosyltransferase n=1 Tax=Synechococcus sp. EJ6-Ellesmere TaxID=2823734 RepID=UPI0020CD22E0|nr:glycosyltransferase [Synechococcus sp. EJ6-Ellesmere]MCP9826369.1 glycosyltransferase [Synechococcus sp. EJ6-Ellesmere]